MRIAPLARSGLSFALRSRLRSNKSASRLRYGLLCEGDAPHYTRILYRGIKSKTKVDLSELTSGDDEVSHGLPLEPATEKGFPTVVQQALDNMEKYKNCVLLTRVGSFYEVSRCPVP